METKMFLCLRGYTLNSHLEKKYSIQIQFAKTPAHSDVYISLCEWGFHLVYIKMNFLPGVLWGK